MLSAIRAKQRLIRLRRDTRHALLALAAVFAGIGLASSRPAGDTLTAEFLKVIHRESIA